MCSEGIFASTSADDSCIVPNRKNFENEIWRVNNNLSKIYNEIKFYWSESKREEIGRLKNDLFNFKNEYYACSEEESKLTQSLKDLQNQHQLKQREVHELEDNDLIYKDLNLARQKLVQVEEQYNKQNFSNMREEQLQVNEVNRIKRNILKLNKYLPLVEQRKAFEASIKTDRQKIREIRQKMRLFRDKIQNCRRKINDVQQSFTKLKEVLGDLKAEKKNLIEKYNDERQEYSLWLKRNKTNFPSTFPSALLQDQNGDMLDLFYCQKNVCKRLINYLKRITASMERRELDSTGNESNNCSAQSTDSDSADDLPESFKHFNMKGHKATSNNRRKKASKRYSMPLSHSIDYIKMFSDIDILPPKMYTDVENVLKEVQKVLEFYENQTAIPTIDDFRCESPIFSTTGSESYGSPFTSPRSLSSCSLVNGNKDNEEMSSHSRCSWNTPSLDKM